MFSSLQAPRTPLRASEEPLTQTEWALQGHCLPAASLGRGLAVGDGMGVGGPPKTLGASPREAWVGQRVIWPWIWARE